MIAESLFLMLGALSFRPAVAQAASLPTLPVARYVAPVYRAPIRRPSTAVGIATTGKAAMLMDGKSGAILFARNTDTAYPIASLTKLMTAMVTIDAHLSMDESILLAKEDEPPPYEGKPVLTGGETLQRRQLLQALLVGSVNTAGNALARTYPGGREAFIAAMNTKAKEIGLDTAEFHDPTGLDPDNVASAQDVARMLQRALSYAEIRDITKHDEAEIKSGSGRVYKILSTNLLLNSFLNKKPYTIIAAKTGSLPQAGFCFAQATQDAAGNELIAVTLGSNNHFSRYQDVKALTAWGFGAFSWE